MTAEEREALAAALPEHQSWCHGEAHAECCGAGDCDCGVADSLDRLLPVVDAIAREAEGRGYERGKRETAEYLLRVADAVRERAGNR